MPHSQEPDKATEPALNSSLHDILVVVRILTDTTARIAVPTLGLAGLGIWSDLKFGTKPWLTLGGLLIGFIIAIFLIRRQVHKSS